MIYCYQENHMDTSMKSPGVEFDLTTNLTDLKVKINIQFCTRKRV